MSHKEMERHHFYNRFESRVGVPLSDSMYPNLKMQVKRNKLHLYAKKPNWILIFTWTMGNKVFQLVYDQFFDELVTILFTNKPFSAGELCR
jgi:hypothetical protein